MNRPLTMTALAFLCLGIALPASNAVGQQKTLKEQIVGTWLLNSVYDQTQDGEKHNPWGDGVKGQAIFTSDGNLSFQIMSANRPKADTSPREPVGPVVAYWGTYAVDEGAKTLSYDIERSSFPQWDGLTRAQTTPWTIETLTDDELHLALTKPIPDPKMGLFVPHLTYKRASAAVSTTSK
jgi:Lipocalin-like domain